MRAEQVGNYYSPTSGSSSLQGSARGVIECWYTKAARLPDRDKKSHFKRRIEHLTWTLHYKKHSNGIVNGED